MFPGPAGVRQDQMSPAPGEPASDAGGPEERLEEARRGSRPHLDADDADVAPAGREGPIAPLETSDSDVEESALVRALEL